MSVPNDLLPLVTQYRAGLEAEISMLHRLAALAERERDVTASGSLIALNEISDARDGVMASLVAIEANLKLARQQLVAVRHRLAQSPEFKELTLLHRQAAELADEIVAADAQSLASLREAEVARRFAQDSLDRGDNTVAAYRRVVSPSLANATLVNRKG